MFVYWKHYTLTKLYNFSRFSKVSRSISGHNRIRNSSHKCKINENKNSEISFYFREIEGDPMSLFHLFHCRYHPL